MRVVALILIIVGMFFTGLFAIAIAANPNDIATGIAIMFFLGNVPLIAGVLLLRQSRAKKRRAMMETAERVLLQLARQNRGTLTASTVAMETPLTVEEAREMLELMVTRGIADVDVDDHGVVAYRFRELVRDTRA